jgi:ABC-type molybdate transport system permease subunit
VFLRVILKNDLDKSFTHEFKDIVSVIGSTFYFLVSYFLTNKTMIEQLSIEGVLGLTALIVPIVVGLLFLIQFKTHRPEQMIKKGLKDLNS